MTRKSSVLKPSAGVVTGRLGFCIRLLPAVFLPASIITLQPHGGFQELPMVLVAAAIGIAVAAAIKHFFVAMFVSVIIAGLLLCNSLLDDLQKMDSRNPDTQRAVVSNAAYFESASRFGQQAASLAGLAENRSGDGKVSLETISVVLPCAFEGMFAVKTVEGIWEKSDHSVVKEIIVVDDGSRPSLRSLMPRHLLDQEPGAAPMKMVEHEKTLGLIKAKQSGGDAATGDIIAFLDCHVLPRPGWDHAFIRQMKKGGDHKTVVVPTITSLDPETWTEAPVGSMGRACYVMLNGDFTWWLEQSAEVPLMSGGLLAMTRKWWEETEGYDRNMIAWGGENIDQSIRTWLCGGRIQVADGAFIAHMWRDTSKPMTRLQYPIPSKDVMRNKARALTGWLNEFKDKAFTFPEYEAVAKYHQSLGDMTNYDRVKAKLQCKPFSYYISHFSWVYLDTGMIPQEVYQMREMSTGRCLERVHNGKTALDNTPHEVILAPCGGGPNRGPVPEEQWWHASNRDASRSGKPCCDGIANWNFHRCLDARSVHSRVTAFECSIQGGNFNQVFKLQFTDKPGLIFWNPSSFATALRGMRSSGCLAPAPQKEADAHLTPLENCGTKIEAVPGTALHDDKIPAVFTLRTESGECAAASGAHGSGDVAALTMEFNKCEADNVGQHFSAIPRTDGYEIRAGDTEYCLDSAKGTKVLLYPCYSASVRNVNQMWKIRDGRLFWQAEGGGSGSCLDSSGLLSKAELPLGYHLSVCSGKAGQRLRRADIRSDGTFLLKDVDDPGCLVRSGNGLDIGECGLEQRWRVFHDDQVQHISSLTCLENKNSQPVLARCVPGHSQQRFLIVDDPGWVRTSPTWGDNGRQRSFGKCLDRSRSEPAIGVMVEQCHESSSDRAKWERLSIFVPQERQLWEKAVKPPPGRPPLGG